MVDVVSSIYEMLGRATQPLVEDSSAKEHVEKIFHVSWIWYTKILWFFANWFLLLKVFNFDYVLDKYSR